MYSFPLQTLCRRSVVCLLGLGLSAGMIARAQVFTVSTEHVDGRALAFQPTNIPLPTQPATVRTREDLIRSLGSEQGFAMRPLPLTSKGVTLVANGPLTPEGSAYVKALEEHGISAKAGDRVVITDIKVKRDRIVLELNGGPDRKHKYLRHIEVGGGVGTGPIVRDDGADPVGSRVTLVFPHDLPDISGPQVESLLGPVIGFGLRSPTEAFVDKLPPLLKKAILEHHVLVGMSSEMVVHAMGQPLQKMREREGQMPFEEWIYGAAPERVEFVRINNQRVIRVEDALVGEPPVVRATNEVGDYWATQTDQNVRMVKLGDTSPLDRAQQNQTTAAPSLRKPGEKLPTDGDVNHPTPQAVQFPKGMDKSGQANAPNSPTPSSTPNTSDKPAAAPAPPATPPAPPASTGPAPTL
jgi:hypothetical protein